MGIDDSNSASGALLSNVTELDDYDITQLGASSSDSEEKMVENESTKANEMINIRSSIARRGKNSFHSNGNTNGPKRTKFLSIWQYMSLRELFHFFGKSVGSYPYVYLALSFLIALNSFGMFKMVMKDRIRDGYTPINAPSRHEMDVIREFWNSSGDPMMAVVLLTARDNGSMFREEYFDEANSLNNFLMNNFTIDYEGESVYYKDVCAPYCQINIAVELLKAGMDYEKIRLKEGKALSTDTTLTYPVAKIDGIDVHVERTLFGVKYRENFDKKALVGIKADDLPKNLTLSQMVTNIDFVKVILLLFRGDKLNADLDKKLTLWELGVFDFGREKYNNPLIDMQVIGTEILDQEMIKDGQKMTPFFAAGFGFMMVFVGLTVLLSAIFYDALDWGKALVAIGTILCPILSITTTYGLISLFGSRTNSFMLVMPFLIMGIGVDDGFLMLHAWLRLANHCSNSVPLRLGMVFEEVGPSITITSLTNFISFGIGALTPTPEIRLFCVATATAMGLDYLFELILFGPVLSIAARLERVQSKSTNNDNSNKSNSNANDNDKSFLSLASPLNCFAKDQFNGWRERVDSFMRCVLIYYCRLIGHRLFTIVLTGALITYWYFAILGALTIKTRLDTVKILPKNSPIQAPNRILSDIIWAEYHPVTVLVNKPLDIRSVQQMNRFWQMVDQFESLPQCRGNISTLLWLRDYKTFYDLGTLGKMFEFFGFDVSASRQKANHSSGTGLDYDRLEEFFSSPFYKHWSTSVQLVHTSDGLRVNRFWFTVAYRNTSTWEQRIEIMQTWRKIAEQYKDLNATVWEANGMFVDQMLSLKSVAIQTGALTLICMAVVCAIFIPNPCSVITASIAIASISLGVFGFLSWWHFDLDPVTMAAVLMSIGLSVDFTAHVSYHYQLTNRKEIRNGKVIKIAMNGQQEKLEHTLQSVGWPMIQAGASTVMCVLPLLFLQSYSPMVFVKTIFLVVAWGLLHGLIVLPAFLGSLPKCLTDANCYRTFLSTSSQRSCRYVGTATSSTEHPSDALQVDDDDDEAEVYEPHLSSV